MDDSGKELLRNDSRRLSTISNSRRFSNVSNSKRLSIVSDSRRFSRRESFRYDGEFRGPLANRSCTDVIFLLMFFIFLIIFGFAGYYAHREGDLNKLLVPRDTKGWQCGKDSEVVDKPNLFFFDLSKCADPLVPIEGCPTPQVCVKECPKTSFYHERAQCDREKIQVYRQKLICTSEIDLNNITDCNEVDKYVKDNKCALWYLPSESYFSHCISDLLPINYKCSSIEINERLRKLRSVNETDECRKIDPALSNICIPASFQDVWQTINRSEVIQGLLNIQMMGSINGIGQLIVEDTINLWPVLAGGFIIAAVCSLIIIAIMRWVAGPIVWISIIGVLALLGIGE
ncbi:hypothetical protein PVAND_009824 [Polypedilum vanderplanki]|uniref:Uncharacterized protein n=1 Tax=Polypedilum vanderplanki TaxID=319348 RepID=A0A9J6CEF1_POLVA|nr:hypothetical protein PVAND_009824 [Polypedilum vanderplanki]